MKFDDGFNRNDGDVYVQCHLEMRVPLEGWRVQTAFIPEEFAVEGMVLKIKQDGKWEDGWKVTGIGIKRIGVPQVAKSIREHRKRTGDSLPKKPR